MLLATDFCLLFTAATFAALPLAGGAVPPQEISNIPMSWQITQGVDPSTGNKHCKVMSLGGDVTAGLSQEDNAGSPPWSVRVGFGNQPGSLRYIRINRQYYTTDKESFRGTEAQEIVAQLGSPGVFAFEWAKAPNSAKHPGLFGTGDFAAKAAACEDWVTGSPT